MPACLAPHFSMEARSLLVVDDEGVRLVLPDSRGDTVERDRRAPTCIDQVPSDGHLRDTPAVPRRPCPEVELRRAGFDHVAVAQVRDSRWQLASIDGDNCVAREGTDLHTFVGRRHDEMARHKVRASKPPGGLCPRPDDDFRIRVKLLESFIVLEPRHCCLLSIAIADNRDAPKNVSYSTFR